MATIRPRKKADGTISYTAQICINRDKVTVYQESQTFARKQAAVAWAKRRETELAEPGAIERASRVGHTVKQRRRGFYPMKRAISWVAPALGG